MCTLPLCNFDPTTQVSGEMSIHPRIPDPQSDTLARVEVLEAQLQELKACLLSSAPKSIDEAPAVMANRIRRHLKARRAREHFFGRDLFADPAWDILLEAYAAYSEDQSTSVTALCNAAAVPSTTALRWVRKLEQDGFLARRDDPVDGRRTWIEITPAAAATMRRYIDAVSVLPL